LHTKQPSFIVVDADWPNFSYMQLGKGILGVRGLTSISLSHRLFVVPKKNWKIYNVGSGAGKARKWTRRASHTIIDPFQTFRNHSKFLLFAANGASRSINLRNSKGFCRSMYGILSNDCFELFSILLLVFRFYAWNCTCQPYQIRSAPAPQLLVLRKCHESCAKMFRISPRHKTLRLMLGTFRSLNCLLFKGGCYHQNSWAKISNLAYSLPWSGNMRPVLFPNLKFNREY
jgi:hypothetical protein